MYFSNSLSEFGSQVEGHLKEVLNSLSEFELVLQQTNNCNKKSPRFLLLNVLLLEGNISVVVSVVPNVNSHCVPLHLVDFGEYTYQYQLVFQFLLYN